MSQPNVPDITPDISITREDALNLAIVSIAMNELSLSHILNAEGEKIQYVLGTLDGAEPLDPAPDLEDLLTINKSVCRTINAITHAEMVLTNKLQELLTDGVLPEPPPVPDPGEDNGDNGDNGDGTGP